MDVLNSNALTQLVEEPTRQQNTLDLILTNHHGKVIRTDTIPGISDHDIVYTEFDLRPVKLQQKPRTIPLYNKANWYGMKIDLQNIKHTLSNMFKDNDCQVTNMWNVFKETITKSAVKHIPQKRTWSEMPAMVSVLITLPGWFVRIRSSVFCCRVGSSTSLIRALLFSTSMKSVCRLGAVEFGFKATTKTTDHPFIQQS
jgi:hypothetical protein